MKSNRIFSGILAGTIAITSFTAPAFADRKMDNTVLTVLGLAALVAVASKRKKSKKSQVTKPQPITEYYTHRHNRSTHEHVAGSRHRHNHVIHEREAERLRQERIAAERHAEELRRRERLYEDREPIIYKHPKPVTKNALPLPRQCKRDAVIDGHIKNAYSKRCLNRNGYTISANGVVRHPSIYGRKVRPNLI